MNSIDVNEIYAINEDGEQIGNKIELRHRKYKTEEPVFVKAYLSDLCQILSVHRGDIAVLVGLIKFMNYDNVIDVTPRIKQAIIELIGYGTLQTVGNSISRLKKAYLIIPINRGSYLIDPRIFAKGGWYSVHKIQMQITYNKDGSKHIKTNFNNKIPESNE